MEPKAGYYNSFVIRIWTEKSSTSFRGCIQHTSSQERIYFTDLNSMNEFILANIREGHGDMITNEKHLLN